MKDMNESVRLRIMELCEQNNMTLHKLCAVSGVTWSTVDNIMKKNTKSTTVATIQKLCDGLEITLQIFFNSPLFLEDPEE